MATGSKPLETRRGWNIVVFVAGAASRVDVSIAVRDNVSVKEPYVKELRAVLRHQGEYLGQGVSYNSRDTVSAGLRIIYKSKRRRNEIHYRSSA